MLCQSRVFPELHTPVQSAVKTKVLLFPGPRTDTARSCALGSSLTLQVDALRCAKIFLLSMPR